MENHDTYFKEQYTKGVLFGNIPHRLSVAGRPELSIFPFNMLFTKWREENGKTYMGHALYEPDIETHTATELDEKMTYRNIYGGDDHVVLIISRKGEYMAEKFIEGKSVGLGSGRVSAETIKEREHEWSITFAHITALGLTPGERCLTKLVEETASKSL